MEGKETKFLNYSDEIEKFVREISFPRHSGTDGDEKIRTLLMEKCKESKLTFFEEKFKASDLFMHVFNRIPYFAWGVLVLVFTFINSFLNTPLTSIVYATLLLVGSFCLEGFIRALKYPVMYLSKKQYETGNIIIGDDARSDDARMNIIIVAHTDSKSETPDPHLLMTIEGISVIFGTWIYATHSLIYSTIKLAHPAIPLHSTLWFLYGLVFASIDMLRIITRYGNESDGACDDGTGVAITLLLMRELKRENFKKIKVIGLLAGAEEVGEVGTYMYIENRKEKLDKGKNHFLIVDGIASRALLYGTSHGFRAKPFSNPLLNSLKRYLAKDNQFSSVLDLKPQWFPPPVNTDHSAVVKQGFPAFVLVSVEQLSHGKDDVPENMDFKALSSVLEFLVAFLHQVDDDIGG
ncbi:MAG: M28 family peptidase [Candidatus Hodarchaeota archaeon]